MGQRSRTETAYGIIGAFIEQSTWSQAALARHLETKPETVRKWLRELKAGGFPLEREGDHPHVYWSVPKKWIPGALALSVTEAADLLRVLARCPRSKRREQLIEILSKRLPQVASGFDPSAVQTAEVESQDEWLSLLEDAASKKVVVEMRYFSASRGDESWRRASVHRIDVGPRSHFIATCHNAGQLRRFRLSNVLDARFDRREPFRAVDKRELAAFDRESLGGFRDEGPVVRCTFFVRNPEAAWVSRNLPDGRIEPTKAAGGVRFSVDTRALSVLARFVAGLGAAARPETPQLASEVAAIAREALANATR